MATVARAVTNIDEAHLVAFAQHQADEIAMHVVEIGKFEERRTAKCFEPAARIPGLVVEQPTAEAIGLARGHALLPAVLTLDPLPRDHADFAWYLIERGEKLRHVRGVVLSVAVEGN